jgi:hypothetical protein
VGLAAAPLGLAAACTSQPSSAPPPTGSPTTPAPADPLVAHLLAEQRFLASYDAVIAAHPSLAKRLTPLRADHAAHVAAMQRELGVVPPSASPSGSAAPTTPGGEPTTPGGEPTETPTVPATPDGAVAMLRKAEHDAAADRAGGALVGTVTTAPLLASIAACEASHQAVLSQ